MPMPYAPQPVPPKPPCAMPNFTDGQYSDTRSGTSLRQPDFPPMPDQNILHREWHTNRASQGLKDQSGFGDSSIGQSIAAMKHASLEEGEALAMLRSEVASMPLSGYKHTPPPDEELRAILYSCKLNVAQAKAVVLNRAQRAFEDDPRMVHDLAWRPRAVAPAYSRHARVEECADGKYSERSAAYARHRLYTDDKINTLRTIAGAHNMSDIPELDALRAVETHRGHIHPAQHTREELFVHKFGGRHPELGGVTRPLRSPSSYATQSNWQGGWAPHTSSATTVDVTHPINAKNHYKGAAYAFVSRSWEVHT